MGIIVITLNISFLFSSFEIAKRIPASDKPKVNKGMNIFIKLKINSANPYSLLDILKV